MDNTGRLVPLPAAPRNLDPEEGRRPPSREPAEACNRFARRIFARVCAPSNQERVPCPFGAATSRSPIRQGKDGRYVRGPWLALRLELLLRLDVVKDDADEFPCSTQGVKPGKGYQRFLQIPGAKMAVVSRSFVYCKQVIVLPLSVLNQPIPLRAWRRLMDGARIFVLTSLYIDDAGNVANRNVGVTFDLLGAEAHRARGIENDFQSFDVSVNWREDAEQSNLVATMRDLRAMVQAMQEAALR